MSNGCRSAEPVGSGSGLSLASVGVLVALAVVAGPGSGPAVEPARGDHGGRHDHRDRDGQGGPGGELPPAAYDPGLALHVVEPQRALGDVVDAAVERAAQRPLVVVEVAGHRCSSPESLCLSELGSSDRGARARRAASARLAWDFTVPTEMPSTSAVSASLSSS